MTVNIDVGNYLSEEDIRDMIINQLRAVINADAERLLSNLAHSLATNICTELLSDEQKEAIRKKTTEIIEDLSSYTVFYRSICGSEESEGYKILRDTVLKNKNRIESITIDKIEKYLSESSVEGLLEKCGGFDFMETFAYKIADMIIKGKQAK